MAIIKNRREWDWQSARYADLSSPEWLDRRVPNRFWDDPENQRRYAIWLGRKLKIRKLDDWYRVTRADFIKNRGRAVLVRSKGSHIQFLRRMFPSRDWKPWLFKYAPQGFWKKRENRIAYLQWLEKQLGYQSPEDWYSVSVADFVANQGISLVSGGRRVIPTLKELYPKHNWEEWRFNFAPAGFWQHRQNRLRFLNWAGRQLGVRKHTDWYQVGYEDIASLHGSTMIQIFGDWPSVLRDAFPEETWHPWRFNSQLDQHWRERDNRLEYMNWLGNLLGYQEPEDWYGISLGDFRKNHGGSFIKTYKHCSSAAVVDCFPDYEWLPWKFKAAPNGFWKKPANRIDYMKWLGTQLGYQKWEDWYSITKYAFEGNFGSSLLQYCDGAPSRPVIECFPEYDWLPWLFHKTPRGFWKQRGNRIQYMKWLGEQLGFCQKKDWEQLRASHFFHNHGDVLWNHYYDRSISKALRDSPKS